MSGIHQTGNNGKSMILGTISYHSNNNRRWRRDLVQYICLSII